MTADQRTIQLRRYEIAPGELDAFVDWWRTWMPTVRPEAGFTIEWAYVDREANEFVWAVSAAGDAETFLELERTYLDSDARAKAFEGVPQRVAKYHVRLVEELPATL